MERVEREAEWWENELRKSEVREKTLRVLVEKALELWPGARASGTPPNDYKFSAYDDWEGKAREALRTEARRLRNILGAAGGETR